MLFVIDALGEGGTERSLADLLPGLETRGVDPAIAILRSRGDEGVEPLLRQRGVDIRVLPAGLFVRQMRAMRSIVRELSVDLVHSMLFSSNMRARALRATGGPAVVNSMVNMSYAPERLVNPSLSSRKLELVRRIDAATTRWVDRFHAVSQPVARHTVDRLGVAPDLVTVVERGRDEASLQPQTPARRRSARASLGVDDDALVVVNLARQEHQKGLDTLLAASALLAPDLDLIVLQAGRSGGATEKLRMLHERLELGERFQFLGHRKDVDMLLAAADVFVFPSRYEGMPGAVIEAMACGLPIVASDAETVVGVLEPGGNALVVPVDDAAALARAVRTLLVDAGERARLAARSRVLFEERFTMDRSVHGMVELYSEVLASTSSGRSSRPRAY